MTKPKQILYFSPTIWNNTDFYRTTGVLPFINHPGLMLRDISHFGQINQWDLEGSDAIIIQRPGTPNGLSLIKTAKFFGLKVVLDYDDDILNVDELNPSYVQYQQQREIILECIGLSDEVWCSTQAVRDSLGRGIVIPNALNVALLGRCADFNSESNKVVWRGGSSHEADIYENADSIVEMINSSPELEFYFIGHRFTYLEQRCEDNYTSVDVMPISQYFSFLKQLKPRAMIFPLCDTKLNRGKSNISWQEAAWVGAAYFGNTNLPEFNIPGTLPIEIVSERFGNDDMLKAAHEASVKNIEENYLLSDINKLRIESLLNI